MHSRNPYCNPPDFSALAAEYQPLKELYVLMYVYHRRQLLTFDTA